ncbi:MAG: NAD(P)-binding domain-containing protein, partial [Treponemataceae bacterium]|nr:NAD(P)-binding domain-containing protein [Treponemataceae bacterium]
MKSKIALMGAGGKMGLRITRNIKDNPNYEVYYIEISNVGVQKLSEMGVSPTDAKEAIPKADFIILAVPDRLIRKIGSDVIPQAKAGAMIVSLDPAAAYAGVIPIRNDLSYFVTHPCHPAIFSEEPNQKALSDYFGGIAKQNVVNALYRGKDEDYAKGDALSRIIYAPVDKTFRITVEQMAILEPGLVETYTLTLIDSMREALEKVISMGVPEEAAKAFLFGHIRVELAIVFG